MLKILVIDEDLSVCGTIKQYLTGEGYEVVTAASGTEGLNQFVEAYPDVVVLDIRLPDVDGFAVLEDLREEDEDIKVILITDHPDMDSTINAMKSGAFDYLHKPIDTDELGIVIKRAIQCRVAEKKDSPQRMAPSPPFRAGDIIGGAGEMREIFKIIGIVSQNRATVLIQGESGTGKELVAKAIHRNTSLEEPFIAVNCSAIVGTLLESELFGHEKGSFTGAFSRKLGKFELARYGTVFLDEISEMSLNLQAKLLRVLQEMEFERVGGRDRVHVQARIIAATNKDLKALVREGRFRDDLYYRLNIVTIEIPPLRKRKGDIPSLVGHLLAKINNDLRKRITGVSDEMMEILLRYRWPGNVRELENLLVGAAVVAKGQILIRSDFPELGEESGPERTASERTEDGRLSTLDDIEEQYIRKVIRESGKNKGEICEILGISRPTFERKLEKYGITFEREG